jgi:hypothetical protein
MSHAPAIDRENPWPGLESFTENARDFFFGREQETEELNRLVGRQTLTVLFGQSGLGKSSLLHAGLFPLLRASDHLPLYLRLDHSPLTPPLAEQVKTALTTAFAAARAEAPAFTPGETLWEYFHRKDVDIWSAKNRLLTPVLAFDQFEEIFTLGRADEACRERSRIFLNELACLVANRAPAAVQARLDHGELDPAQFNFAKPSCQVILSLREDFLPDLEGLKQQMPALVHNRLRLKRLTGTQALDIVQKPAPHLLAAGVAERIVEFVAGARGGSAERLAEFDVEPPLLSVICRELNERRRALGQAQITVDLVSGNRREILTNFYERSVADLPEAMRTFVEERLLTKSGFRDNLALESALESPGVTRPLIDTLVARRLLRIEDRLGVQRVELTHDVLAEVIRGARDARREQEARAAEERRRLATESELAASRAREAEAKRGLVRARLIAAGCAVLAFAAIAATVFGYNNLRRARAAEAVAQANAARAQEKERLAFATRAEAERVVNYLVEDLATDLQPLGRLSLLSNLFRGVLAYYDGVPADQSTPEGLINQASAYSRASRISFLLGLRQQSEEQLDRARAALAAAGNRADPEKTDLARADLQLTISIIADQSGDAVAGVVRAREALALLEPWLAQPKPSLRVLRLASQATFDVGQGLTRSGDPAAIAYLERSAELSRGLIAAGDNVNLNRRYLGANLAWTALAANRSGLVDQVVPRAREALQVLEQVRAEDPNNVVALGGMASALNALAEGYRALNQPGEAAALKPQMKSLSEARLRVDPLNLIENNNAMIIGIYSGLTYLRQGEIADALAALRENDSTALIAAKGTSFHKNNLLRLRAERAEVLAAVGGSRAAREEQAIVEQVGRELIAAESPDSPAYTRAVQRLETARRQSALAAGEFAIVRASARASVQELTATAGVKVADPSSQRVLLRNAQHSLGIAAAEESDWAEAASALQDALAADLLSAGAAGNRVVSEGVVSALSAEASAATRRAELQTWRAWVFAHQPGQAAAAVAAATEARDFQRQQLTIGDGTDQSVRLAAAFAEVAFARAQLAAAGPATEIRSSLAEAGKLLASLSDEFKGTSWVQRVQTKLAATRALVP